MRRQGQVSDQQQCNTGHRSLTTLQRAAKTMRSTGVGCQHAPRLPYTEDRCLGAVLASLLWCLCRTYQSENSKVLMGSFSRSFLILSLSKGLCCLHSSPHLAPRSRGAFDSSTRLTLELLCCERVRREHAINTGQPTNRLSYYYSRQ